MHDTAPVRCGGVTMPNQVLRVEGLVEHKWVSLFKFTLRVGEQKWDHQTIDTPKSLGKVRFRFEGYEGYVVAVDEVHLSQYSSPCSPQDHPSCKAATISKDLRAAITQAEQRADIKHREQTELIRVAEARQAELRSLEGQIAAVKSHLAAVQAAKIESMPANLPTPAGWDYSTLFSTFALILAGYASYRTTHSSRSPTSQEHVLPSSPAILASPVIGTPTKIPPASPSIPFSPLPKDIDTKSVAELQVLLSSI